MATLVFTAIGTALGGPLGGAIGGLIGNQIDRAVIGGGKREGPRLKELGVSTSTYGSPISRHHGRIRAPGTIVWSTDLVERKDTGGGGKGKPSVTSSARPRRCSGPQRPIPTTPNSTRTAAPASASTPSASTPRGTRCSA